MAPLCYSLIRTVMLGVVFRQKDIDNMRCFEYHFVHMHRMLGVV